MVVYPLQTVATLPENISDWFEQFMQNRQQLKSRIADLERINRLNSFRLQKLASLRQENNRLRELLGSSFRLSERVMVAEVLHIDLDPYAQKIVIDKGTRDGVYVGQPVLDAKGVMGQVISVSPISSYVMLLTNPSHAIPIQINRSGLRAIVSGRGSRQPLQLKYVPHHADIRVGDVLVTSGLGGRFPPGYPVGTIEAIDYPQGEAFADIRVKPAAELAISHHVLLVLPGKVLLPNKESEHRLKGDAHGHQ